MFRRIGFCTINPEERTLAMVKNMPPISLLYGPPCAGKTTIAKRLCSELGFVYISVGQLVRHEISVATDFGNQCKDFLQKKLCYPTDFITSFMEEKLITLDDGTNLALMDGFPKYLNEAEAFLSMLLKNNWELRHIIIVDVPFEIIKLRAENRKICSQCGEQYNGETVCSKCGVELAMRDDDQIGMLKYRFDNRKRDLPDILQLLGNHAQSILQINGCGLPNEVYPRIKKVFV